jgi:hypothetical protein
MTQYRLPSRSAYPAGSVGEADRWQDYTRIREGKPPLLGDITEAEPVPAPVPKIPPLHELRIKDPESFNELRRAFADSIFAGHDRRSGGGRSPFNKGMGD